MQTPEGPTRIMTFCPAVRRGNGTGHLVRALRCAEALAAHGDNTAVEVYVGSGDSRIDVASVARLFPDAPLVERIHPETDVVVLDQRKTDPHLLQEIPEGASVIAVDETGDAAERAEFTVRMISSGPHRVNADVVPDLPHRRRPEPPKEISRVLVTFGGEDPAGLTAPTVFALLDAGIARHRISVVRGPSFDSVELPEGVQLLPPSRGIRERFHDYDLVVTSFGLTALEARGAGCAVAVVDPSRYHARLSRGRGFFSLGVGRVVPRRLRRLFRAPAEALHVAPPRPTFGPPRRATRWAPGSEGGADFGPAEELSEALMNRQFEANGRCPVCGRRGNRAVLRLPHATFFHCRCSGTVYRVGFERERTTYGTEYFFEEYRRQYGRTYLEDFDSICRLAEGRLDRIDRAVTKRAASPAPKPRLLDIGCAYGPFLQAARDRGYEVFGVDVAADPIRYVTKELGIDAVQSEVERFVPEEHGRDRFDVVTLWYVIEHFEDLGGFLEQARRLVGPGGILAFSTPNLAGVSGRTDRRGFLERSPTDHYTVLSPRSAKAALARHGFSVESIRITGHHPERFPLLGAFTRLHPLLKSVSRLFGLGDTFELYARDTGGKRV